MDQFFLLPVGVKSVRLRGGGGYAFYSIFSQRKNDRLDCSVNIQYLKEVVRENLYLNSLKSHYLFCLLTRSQLLLIFFQLPVTASHHARKEGAHAEVQTSIASKFFTTMKGRNVKTDWR